jgi:hypothetical protein
MASLTTKHLLGLMLINAATVHGVDPTTVQYLQRLGLVYERQGYHGVTLKGKKAIGAMNEAVTTVLHPTDVNGNGVGELAS